MRNIFIDANVIIDWLNKDSAEHELCTQCIQTIAGLYKRPMVSNTSIAITFYFISKNIRDKSRVVPELKEAFSFFSISTEDAEVAKQAFDSDFKDLEDAIQYYSAIRSKADAIITFNTFDFSNSKIPVMHPAEFLQLHTIS